ncbi:DnaJ-domain-containing protein [Decorospora gaudefroyi]|uniref:DnaJ-domain-containing protein n=1 Tax=Decorospora gaudefroyi TaxID=184978 RepID=A0A6A5K5S2_9PLEO|nr:DnaJ-domain-containing protein [Decorospora gaudefroyi]
MQTPTYYSTLGLAPNAPPEVIRAAYKALALIYHPDKTLELAASDRAAHAAVFRDIQEAFDVLSKPNFKATYDAELARHHGSIDEELSTFHRRDPSTPKRKTAMKLATPEEKEARIATARQQLEYLREQRAKRHGDEAQMDIAELKSVVQIWCDLADENQGDPTMQAHCTIRAHEYLERVAERERQHEKWLRKISTSRHASAMPATPATPERKSLRPTTPNAPEKPTAAATTEPPQTPITTSTTPCRATSPTTTPCSRSQLRVLARKRAIEKRAEEAEARAKARREKKIQIEVSKQAKIEQKAALVRAEKGKQRAKVEQQARQNAERIARARAKVRAAAVDIDHSSLLGDTEGDAMVSVSDLDGDPHGADNDNEGIQENFKLCVNSACVGCGLEHEGFREWKKCRMRALVKNEDSA